MGDDEEAKRLFALGSQAANAGDDSEAHSKFSDGLDIAISVEIKSALLISRSRALAGLQLWDSALEDAEACQKLRPSWSRTFECKAVALDGLGRSAEADASRRLAAALAALKQDPKNEELKQNVRAIRQEITALQAVPEPAPEAPAVAQPVPASQEPSRGKDEESEEAKELFAKGMQASKEDDYRGAHEHFSQSLSVARTIELRSALLVSRSAVLCSMMRWQEALEDAEGCIRIRKSWARSYSCQATALDGLGRSEEAGLARSLSSALADLKKDPKSDDLKKNVRAIRQEVAEYASTMEQRARDQAAMAEQQAATENRPADLPSANGPEETERNANETQAELQPATDKGPGGNETQPAEAQSVPVGEGTVPAGQEPQSKEVVDLAEAPAEYRPTIQAGGPGPSGQVLSHSSAPLPAVQNLSDSSGSGRKKFAAAPPPDPSQLASIISPQDDAVQPHSAASPNAMLMFEYEDPGQLPADMGTAGVEDNDWPSKTTAPSVYRDLNKAEPQHIESSEAKSLVSKANSCQRMQNFQGAIDLYSQALEHARNIELKSAILFNRSVAHARMRRWDDSLDDANKCVTINPTWSRGPESQGTALEGLGRWPEALSAFETALSLDPKNQAIMQSMDEIRQKLAAQHAQANAHRAVDEVDSISRNDGNLALPDQRPEDSRPTLVKASSYHGSAQQSFVQDVNVPSHGRVLQWTVRKWEASKTEMSLTDIFPDFPNPAYLRELPSSHSVHVRGIQGSTENSSGVTLKIPGPDEGRMGRSLVSAVVIDGCQDLTLMMDSVDNEISLISCKNTTVVVGQRLAKSGIFVLNCTNCKVVMSRHASQVASTSGDMNSIVKTSASSEVYLVLVKDSHAGQMAGMRSLELLHLMQNRQQVEKIMIPDCFVTELTGGSLATQCNFAADIKQERQRQASAPQSPPVVAREMAAPAANFSSPSLPPAALPQFLHSPAEQPVASHGTGRGHEVLSFASTPFLGTSVLEFKLTLAIDSVSAGLHVSNQRASFELMLVKDLASASGIPEDHLKIQSLGENVVVVAHVKVEGSDIDQLQLAAMLENQMVEPSSKLRSGDVTQFVRAIAFPFDLRSGAVGFKLKLGLDFQDAGASGTVEREHFERMYIADLCDASGASASQFCLLQVSPGSIVVETEIRPDFTGGSTAPRSILENLEQQAMHEQSQLRNGQLTRYLLTDAKKTAQSPPAIPPAAGQAGAHDPAVTVYTTPPLPAQDLSEPSPVPGRNKYAAKPAPSLLDSMTNSHGHTDATMAAMHEGTGAMDVRPALCSPESATPAVSPPMSQVVDMRAMQGEKRVGVGLAIMQDSQGSFIVADVMPDSPALAAGLQAGDILESVDDRSVRELRQSDVVRLLRGPAGSMVKVDIAREFFVGDDTARSLVRRTFVLTRPISGKNANAQSPYVAPPDNAVRHEMESSPKQAAVDSLLQLPALELLSQRTQGLSKVGVGLGVTRDANGFVRVKDILSGSASQINGAIQRNDIIKKIDNVSVHNMHPNDVVELLRGPENSNVKLDMRRNDWRPLDGTTGLHYFVNLRRNVLFSPETVMDVPVSLTLDMAIWQVGDVEVFKREVCYDVARALGGSVKRVKAIGLRAGSVIVDLILTANGRSGPQLLDELAAQARDPGSPLMLAQHTCRTVDVSPGPPEVKSPKPKSHKADAEGTSERFRTRGTVGLSHATNRKIMQEVDLDMQARSVIGPAPVPLVPLPESLMRSQSRPPSTRTGIGLGLTAGKGLVYTVCGLTPGGAAHASGQFQEGDVVHSVDGVPVTGKSIGEIQELVIGEAGSKVMIAVLRSDAVPEDLQLNLDQFERWRPVVIVRNAARSPAGGLPSGTSGTSFEARPESHTRSPTRKSIWPIRDGREVIAVDLVLDEDYSIIASTASDKADFSAQLTDDISTALSVPPEQVSVVDLQPGSVVAVIQFFSAGDYNNAKDPEELAMQIMKQASDHSSPLRHCVSCRRAKYARARMADRPMARQPAPFVSPPPRSLWGNALSSGMSSAGYGGGRWVELGFSVNKAAMDRFCQVQELRPGGPAELSACIFPGNYIISVDGRSMDDVPVDEVVECLEQVGVDTPINLGVLRPRGSQGALKDRDVTTVVALRRGSGQEASSLLPTALYALEPMPLLHQSASSEQMRGISNWEGYTGSCRVVDLQRRPEASRTKVGIGLLLQRSWSTGHVMVTGLMEGRVAADSGQIFVGDILHQVDNVPTKGKSLDEVVKMIQGSPDSPVILMLQSTRGPEELDEQIDDDCDVQDIPMITEPAQEAWTREPVECRPEKTDTTLSPESAISAISPSTSKNVDKQGEKRVGVGLAIMQDSQGSFIVADVMPDSPALAAGLQAGDILESVDNRSVRELRQSNVVRLLRGPAGSMVKVDIAREVQVVDDCAPKLVRRTFVLTRLISGKNTNAQSQVPYSPSSPAASILPQKLNASFVEKKLSLQEGL